MQSGNMLEAELSIFASHGWPPGVCSFFFRVTKGQVAPWCVLVLVLGGNYPT